MKNYTNYMSTTTMNRYKKQVRGEYEETYKLYVKNSIYRAAAAVANELLCGACALSLRLQQYCVRPTAVGTTRNE